MAAGRERTTWYGETKMTTVQIAQEEVKKLEDSLFHCLSFSVSQYLCLYVSLSLSLCRALHMD